jgi:predicted MFS family arabinose efflux permease
MFLGIGSGVILPFQNLFFREVFGLSDSGVGIILATVAVCMGLGALIGAPIGVRIGLRRGATILRIISVAGALIMLIPSLIPATIGFIIRGTFIVASYPMSDALVMANTPLRQRGMAMSLSSVFWAGGWAAGALAGGYMQVRWGFNPLIIFAAVNYLFSALAILTLVFPEGDTR